MSTFKVLVAMVTPPNLRQTPKNEGGITVQKIFFLKKYVFIIF